jgi:glycosyltransferase involved in cell wall biosynthesis
MAHTPLVSAIVASYNRAHIVGEAIESILRQSYKNIEILVVDDGSTDDTVTKLACYGDSIRVITQKNGGPGAARNRGLKESTGELIAFLDSDDLWLPHFIERQVRLLERAGSNVACSLSNAKLQFASGKLSTSFDFALFEVPNGESIWLNPGEVLATRSVMFTQMVVARRTALERVGGFDESLWSLEDYDLALKLSLQGPWGLLSEPLVVWRQGATDGLTRKAYDNEIQLKKNLVVVKQRALDQLRNAKQFDRMGKILQRELGFGLLDLKATKMEHTGNVAVAAMGRLLKLVKRTRMIAYRRTPWFPKLKLQGLPITEDKMHVDSIEDSPLGKIRATR